MGVVLDVLRSATKSSQVVVTTHSPELLDAKWIKDRHLRLVSWENGVSRIDSVAPSVSRAMSKEMFGAGELLRSNALTHAQRTCATATSLAAPHWVEAGTRSHA